MPSIRYDAALYRYPDAMIRPIFRPSATLPLLTVILLTACSAGATPSPTPNVLILTATPPAIPTRPDLSPTAEFLPTADAPPQATQSGAVTVPTPVSLPTDQPTPRPITPGPSPTPSPSNRLANPGFEGALRRVDFDAVNVVNAWRPFYCAEPYTPSACGATRSGSGNDEGLSFTIPEYARTTAGFRVHGGNQAQQWWCQFRVCRGGVYQTFATTPGEVCEIGAWVQTWSAESDGGPRQSDLRTQDERDNSTWYVRVDPTGGGYAWGENVRASPGFGYTYGVYDQYVRISHTFTAASSGMTVFIENVRLWPVKNNYSFIDDAFAYCSMPANAVDTTLPTEAGLKIGPFVDARGSLQPVFGTPAPGTWDGGDLALSDVARVGDEFWMYYTAGGGVGLATSPDGVNWTRYGNGAVFTAGAAWEGTRISQPTVVYDAESGQFHMWYNTLSEPGDNYTFGFGYATSPDGVNWTRQSGEPVLTTGTPGGWNEERVDGPNAIQVGDEFVLCNSGTALEPAFIRSIGCFTSGDGIDWTPYLDNPVISPHPNFADWEGNEVELPSLAYHDGLWLMAYTGFGGPQGNRFRIGLAASLDGLEWQHLYPDPVIPWVADNESTGAPSIYIDAERGQLWLWYVFDRASATSRAIYAAVAPITLP